jgi:thiol-disulfide isomerase/thioredoxin
MIKRTRSLWIGLAGTLLWTACSANSFGQITWSRSLSDALSRAAGKKLIVADMYADWCGWCKKMDEETWPNPQVAGLQDKYVFLKLNAEKEPDGLAMLKKFRINSFPTTMILNPDGSEFDRILGFQTAPQFVRRLSDSVDNPESFGNLKAREIRSPDDLALRCRVARELVDRLQFREAADRLQQIIKLDPGNKSGSAPDALLYLAICQASLHDSESALLSLEQLRKRFPQSPKISDAMFLSGEILLDSGRQTEGRARLEEFLKAYPDHRMAAEARKLLLTL